MMKWLISAFLIACGTVLALPSLASAHVLKIDGSIGAVLHINPDDNPIAGDSTDYTLSFDDQSGKFSLPKCDCTVSIIKNGATLASKPLADSSDTVSEDHYTFPTPAVYTMHFTGKPRTPDAFQPFTLDYEVRATGRSANTQPIPPALWIGIGMAIGLILLAALSVDDSPIEKDKGGVHV